MTIQDGWVSLVAAAGLGDMSKVQQHEMRKAFFSGAAFILTELYAIADHDEETAANELETLHREAGAFFEPTGGAWENPYT